MDEDKNILPPTPPVPDTDPKVDSLPQESTKKIRIIPWIILGLLISLIVVFAGFLVWKIIVTNIKPDIVLNAPNTIPVSSEKTPSKEDLLMLESPEIYFEEKPYINELARFQINVPLKWKVDDSGQSGSVVVLYDIKPTIASGSALLTTINVSTGKASGETLESYVNSGREGLVKSFDKYVIEEDKDILFNSRSYHLIGGSFQAHGVKMKNRNLLLVYDNRGYAISATAPESVWIKNELMLNATLFSFKNF